MIEIITKKLCHKVIWKAVNIVYYYNKYIYIVHILIQILLTCLKHIYESLFHKDMCIYQWKDSLEKPNCINKDIIPTHIFRVLLLKSPFSFNFEIFIKHFKSMNKSKIGIFSHCKKTAKHAEMWSLILLRRMFSHPFLAAGYKTYLINQSECHLISLRGGIQA